MNASSVSATSLVPPQPAPAGLLIPTSAFQAIKSAPAPAPVGAVSGNNAVPLSQLTLPAANQGCNSVPLVMPGSLDKPQVLTMAPQTDPSQLLRQLLPATIIISPSGNLQSTPGAVTTVASLTNTLPPVSVLSKTSVSAPIMPIAQTGIMQTVSSKGNVSQVQVGTIIAKGSPNGGPVPLQGVSSLPLHTLQLPVLTSDATAMKQECPKTGVQLNSAATLTNVAGQLGNVVPLASQSAPDNALTQAMLVAMEKVAQTNSAAPSTTATVPGSPSPISTWITQNGILIPKTAGNLSGLEVNNLPAFSGAVSNSSPLSLASMSLANSANSSPVSQPMLAPQVPAAKNDTCDITANNLPQSEATCGSIQNFASSCIDASLAVTSTVSSTPTVTLTSTVMTSRAPPSYAASTSSLRLMQPGLEAQHIQEISQMLRNSADKLTAQQKAKESANLNKTAALESQIPTEQPHNSVDSSSVEQQYPLDLHLERTGTSGQIQGAADPEIITIEIPVPGQREFVPNLPSCRLMPQANPAPDLAHQNVQLQLANAATDRQEIFSPGIFNVTFQDVQHISEESLSGTYCVDCNAMLSEPCPTHGPVQCYIRDSPVLSLARRSLPTLLYFKHKAGNPNGKVTGVFCREEVQARTKFGPLIAALISNETGYPKYSFLKLMDTSGAVPVVRTLDIHNEDQGNWLIFLRRAWPNETHNTVAYHENGAIYFVTQEAVLPGRELLYWPSKDYAALLNVPESPNMYQKNETLFECVFNTDSQSQPKFSCQSCPAIYTTESKLRSHKRIHRPPKQHRCEQCSKIFSDKSNLQAHMSIHSGARPFICSQCSKTFRQKAHLQSHLLTHSGEKSIKCPFCDKMFARNSDLHVHESRHTHERVFFCDYPGCSKMFYKLQTFKKHKQNLHGGQKDFKCPLCSKAFHSNYHVRRHQKSCTKKQQNTLLKNPAGPQNNSYSQDAGKTVKAKIKKKCSEYQENQELEFPNLHTIVGSVESDNIPLPSDVQTNHNCDS